ncbi:MAG: MutS-related protein [Candidatus Cyclobacteriaceae bacterium M3_2C_046]
MIFPKKQKNAEKLNQSFGQPKDETFNFSLIEKYFQNKDHSDALQVISDRTCNDLDFDELFMYLDRTSSRVGQQYLYDQIRTFPDQEQISEEDERLIQQFGQNIPWRISIQQQLQKLGKKESFYIASLFQEEHITPPPWFWIIPLLSFTSFLSMILIPFQPQLFLLMLSLFIVNLGIHYWNKKHVNEYIGSIPQLLVMNRIAKWLYRQQPLKFLQPALPEGIRSIDQVKNRMLLFQMEAKMQGDIEVLFWTLLEFIKILFLLEPLLLFRILKQLDSRRRSIDQVFSFVGKIDSLIAVASLRSGLKTYCKPAFTHSDKPFLQTEGLYHPLIPDCVDNHLRVDKKSVLLTGSNMSGKTSFIRTIGINVVTGLTLNTCFAHKFLMPRCRIYSAIRISDDLMNDVSYYLAEVLTIREMILCSKDEVPSLFLLDEIFKGTNTIERIAAGKAVLSSLAKENLVFVSTHDIELADLLKEEYDLYHFSEIVQGQTIDFDYKLKDGKLRQRNAIRILQIKGYPPEIIEEALKLANLMERFNSKP